MIGLIGSSRVDQSTDFSRYEPVYGSAPKYTGTGLASPLGTVRALATLLEGIGLPRAADLVGNAIDDVLVTGTEPSVTARSGVSTSEAADAIIGALGGDASRPTPAWAGWLTHRPPQPTEPKSAWR